MNKLTAWLSRTAGREDIILATMLMLAVFMMILPLPTELIDLLIAINLSCAIILLIIAIRIKDPLEFSSFPSMLLITTLYRLALTISTSRLILLQHDAGQIVYTFGNLVVGGNVAVGIIVFSIITIVQFIVITKGSERVAEVSARFSLDGMPGKQMSIDGDMRAGAIDAREAKRLRALIQKESQLYGAMDGAMKFVKGDAIASIIVILVNILGGISVGVLQHNMSASEALNTYALLSVGDGLIAQIPALLISVTAGIIVTRVPGEQRQDLATELVQQVGRQPLSLQLTGVGLLVFAIIPGFPLVIFGGLAAVVFAISWNLGRKRQRAVESSVADGAPATSDEVGEINPGAIPLIMYIAPDLYQSDLKASMQRLRWQLFEQLGLPLPEIKVEVAKHFESGQCHIPVYQEMVLQIRLQSDEALLTDPVKRLPARAEPILFGRQELHWLSGNSLEQAKTEGLKLVEGDDRLVYLMRRVIEQYANEFIGVQETRFLMDAMEVRYEALIKEVQRQLSIAKVAEVLQRLVSEGVSIRDLRTIFEALLEWGGKEKDIIMLTEYVRIALRRHIRNRFSDENKWISALMIGEGIENIIRESIRETNAGAYCTLEPPQIRQIVARIKKSMPDYSQCVLITSIDVRRFLRKLIERDFGRTAVLSFQELGDDADIKVIEHVDLVGEELNAVAG